MSRTLMTVAVALILVTAGCMGGTGSETTPDTTDTPVSTTAAPGTANDQMTTTPTATTTDGSSTETTAVPTGSKDFQTGNQTGTVVEAIDGATFQVYYEDHDAKGVVKLADVAVPSMNASDNDPATFHYHEAADDAEMQEHREALRAIGYEATKTAKQELGGGVGQSIKIVHTGETTEAGVPLVYIYFDWDGRTTLYNEYVAGHGLGVLTNPDSPHADGISKAQAWAKDNDEGLWANNEKDE